MKKAKETQIEKPVEDSTTENVEEIKTEVVQESTEVLVENKIEEIQEIKEDIIEEPKIEEPKIEEPKEKTLEDFEEYKNLKLSFEDLTKNKSKLEKQIEEVINENKTLKMDMLVMKHNVEDRDYFEFLFNKASLEKDFDVEKFIKSLKSDKPLVFKSEVKQDSLLKADRQIQSSELSAEQKRSRIREILSGKK